METIFAAFGDYALILPEAILVVGALLAIIFGVFRDEAGARSVAWFSLALLVVAIVVTLRLPADKKVLFDNALVFDAFARFMKVLSLAGAGVVLFMSISHMQRSGLLKFEYPILILFAVVGMMVMISSNSLMSLYMGLELQSLSLYAIAAFRREAVRSSEAGLKYFVLGALASGMLLYGASLIYGFTGTTLIPEISNFIGNAKKVAAESGAIFETKNLGLMFGLVFLLAGLAFKISAVPFHMWTPDVYEGAPTPVTAFFAAAPKIAAMALLVRVAMGAFPLITTQWQAIVTFLAIASMLLGAFAAIGQRNIKRLMAYSSIGHMGFALVGLASGSADGAQAVLIYMTIYAVMTVGAFACILSMRRNEGGLEDIDALSGLAQNNLPMAVFLGLILFSLAGIPPLAGFFAKFYVFLAAIQAGQYALAIIGVLASVVGAFYYLRIVKIMFFDEPAEKFDVAGRETWAVIAASGLLVLLYVAYPAPLVSAAEVAAKSLF